MSWKRLNRSPGRRNKEVIRFFRQYVCTGLDLVKAKRKDHSVRKCLETNCKDLHPHVLRFSSTVKATGRYLVSCTQALQNHNSGFLLILRVNQEEGKTQSWSAIMENFVGADHQNRAENTHIQMLRLRAVLISAPHHGGNYSHSFLF